MEMTFCTNLASLGGDLWKKFLVTLFSQIIFSQFPFKLFQEKWTYVIAKILERKDVWNDCTSPLKHSKQHLMVGLSSGVFRRCALANSSWIEDKICPPIVAWPYWPWKINLISALVVKTQFMAKLAIDELWKWIEYRLNEYLTERDLKVYYIKRMEKCSFISFKIFIEGAHFREVCTQWLIRYFLPFICSRPTWRWQRPWCLFSSRSWSTWIVSWVWSRGSTRSSLAAAAPLQALPPLRPPTRKRLSSSGLTRVVRHSRRRRSWN